MNPTRSGGWRCQLSFEYLPGTKTPPSLGGICSNAVEILQWKYFLIPVFWFVPVPSSPVPVHFHEGFGFGTIKDNFQPLIPFSVVLHQGFGLVLVKLSEAPDTSFPQALESFSFLSACPPVYLPSPGLASLAGLLRLDLWSPRSLTETLTRMGLMLAPWGDTVSIQTALLYSWSHSPWGLQSCQFSMYLTICISNPWLTSLGTGTLWEITSKTLQSVVQLSHHRSQ